MKTPNPVVATPRLMVPFGHKDKVTSVNFSASGKMVLTGSTDQTAILWEAHSGKMLHLFNVREMTRAYFFNQGKQLLIPDELSATVYETATGQPNTAYEFPIEHFYEFFFPPQGAAVGYWYEKKGGFLNLSVKMAVHLAWPDGRTEPLFTLTNCELLHLSFSEDGESVRGFGYREHSGQYLPMVVHWQKGDKKAQMTSLENVQELVKPDVQSIDRLRRSLVALHRPNAYAVFSPDGATLWVNHHKKLVKIELPSGKKLSSLKVPRGTTINTLALSPDGGQLAMGCSDHRALLWDARTDELLLAFEGHEGPISDIAFSPAASGQQLLTGSDDRTAILWDSTTGARITHFKGRVADFDTIAVAPGAPSTFLTESWGNAARLWDITTGQPLVDLQGHQKEVLALAYSPDGQWIATGGRDNALMIWKVGEAKATHIFSEFTDPVRSLSFSKDGQRLLAHSARRVQVWKTQNWKLALHIKQPPWKNHKVHYTDQGAVPAGEEITAAAFITEDGSTMAIGGNEGIVQLIDVASGKLLTQRTQIGEEEAMKIVHPVRAIALHPEAGCLFAAAWNLYLFYPPLTKAIDKDQIVDSYFFFEQTTELQSDSAATQIFSLCLSADGQLLLTGSDLHLAVLWERSAEVSDEKRKYFKSQTRRKYSEELPFYRQKLVLRGHIGPVRSLAFFPDHSKIITGGGDHTARIWDAQSGEELLTIYQIGSSDWVHLAPSGMFDASPGAMALMHYVVNQEGHWTVIALDQLKERYYEPGLFAKVTGAQQEELRDVSEFANVRLFPLIQAAIQQDQLTVQLEERNGGIGKVSLFINQKEVLEEANPSRSTSFSIDLRQFEKYYLPDEENTLTLYAYNEDNWLKSQPFNLRYTPPPAQQKGMGREQAPARAKKTPEPRLFGLVAGTSNYRHPPLRLHFADKDARAIAGAIEGAGRQLFAKGVDITLLTTEAEAEDQLSSKKNIEQAFRDIAARAKPWDVFFCYFSGHGANHGPAEQSLFYYITRDVPSGNLSDPEIRKNYTISSNELTEWINHIPARKQVLILDACHAGKAVDSLVAGQKKINSSQIRALDRMKDRTGTFVLAGSAADKVSYESSQFGQGLLTYCLLLGMSGVALTDDRRVDIMKLFQYTRDQVPRFARQIGGIQVPVLAFPHQKSSIDSFDIGLVTEKVSIPLAQARPMIIRSNYMDSEEYDDGIDLSDTIDHLLREEMLADPVTCDLIFLDVAKYEEAYVLRGGYTITEGRAAVHNRLFLGKKKVGSFELEGEAEPVQDLAGQIIRAAKKLIRQK